MFFTREMILQMQMISQKYTKLWTRHNDIARGNVGCDDGCLDLLAGFLLPVLGLCREKLGGDVRDDTTLGDNNVP